MEHRECTRLDMSKESHSAHDWPEIRTHSVHKTGHIKEHTECTGLARLRTHRVLRTGQNRADTEYFGLARCEKTLSAQDCPGTGTLCAQD